MPPHISECLSSSSAVQPILTSFKWAPLEAAGPQWLGPPTPWETGVSLTQPLLLQEMGVQHHIGGCSRCLKIEIYALLRYDSQ